MSRLQQRAFTLIELMITVAILAIIAAIAIPSYAQFTKRAHLRDAQSALVSNAHTLEQYYVLHHNFGASDKRPALSQTSTAHFSIAFSSDGACKGNADDGDHYCLKAVAKNTSSEPRTLVMTETGQTQLCEKDAEDAGCETF